MSKVENVELERAILSRLLLDPEQIPLLAEKLKVEDFASSVSAHIWQAMLDLVANGKVVDIQTVSVLAEMPVSDLSRYVEVPSGLYTAPLGEYADIVRAFAFRRKVIRELQNVIGEAEDNNDPNDILATLSAAVDRIGLDVEHGGLVDPSAASAAYSVELALRRGGNSPGLAYNVGDLDRLLQPARPGDMIVVAARPSIGKTAFAENVAESWAAQGQPVLFASLEMSLNRLLDRAIARQSGLDSDAIVRGNLTDSQYDLAMATAAEISDVNIWYLDDPSATTASIRAAAARMRMLTGGLGAIIIDYLQLLRDPGDQEVQRVTRISRAIKTLALEFDCPVMVLSQLNRAVESREDARPRLHDLRESGAIEQDADVVVAISRDGDEATFSILKQRHGVRGTEANLHFDGPHVRWTDGWRDSL